MKTLLLSSVCALALGGAAQAMVVSSFTGGTVLPMPVLNYFGPGPQVFGDVTWTSSNAFNLGGAVFGYNLGYGFGSNGFWYGAWANGLGAMAAINSSFDDYGVSDSMTFTFGTPVDAVGGFINYAPGASTPTILAVFDVGGALIEQTTLTFSTGGGTDTGQFVGFVSATPIKSFVLTDNYVGLVDLRVNFTSVPAPAALALFGLGLLGLAGLRARRA